MHSALRSGGVGSAAWARASRLEGRHEGRPPARTAHPRTVKRSRLSYAPCPLAPCAPCDSPHASAAHTRIHTF
eukprot:3772811-Prymnesium_polylepis.2